MTYKEHFIFNLADDPNDLEAYWRDAFGLIHEAAINKGIEFDGYFDEKWEDAADTVTNFNEFYFDDEERRKLYVYLSALYDPEIMIHLKDAYYVAGENLPSEEDLKKYVQDLIDKGVRF